MNARRIQGVAMALALVLLATAAGAATGERVTFASAAPHPATGEAATIGALLFRPADMKPGERRPALVALHGCGGMYSESVARRERLSPRHQAAADLLVAEGYVVLFPDSFRSRGVEEICTKRARERTVTVAHRQQDARAALAWLQRRDDVLADRVAVLGWSNGGSTVLGTLDGRDRGVVSWLDAEPKKPYFRAGVAFYPGCSPYLRGMRSYTLATPLELYIGDADDWTPPQPCIDLAANLAAAREPIAITVYPGAHHGFDGPSTVKRVRMDVPGGANPGKGVTVATDPAARDDAHARMKAFLRERLAP
jgi:dienelactone hydrolase